MLSSCHVVFRLVCFQFHLCFAFGQIIYCFQHAAFTLSSEMVKALMLVCVEVFVGPSGTTLTTNSIQMFCELDDDFW